MNILEFGGKITNETRSFDTLTKETLSMRDKEVFQVGNEVTRESGYIFLVVIIVIAEALVTSSSFLTIVSITWRI